MKGSRGQFPTEWTGKAPLGKFTFEQRLELAGE